MSRSRKKTPITGITTCQSEKHDKQLWHRRFRRAAKQRDDFGEFDHWDRYSDPWDMGKDGKRYWGKDNPELMRK